MRRNELLSLPQLYTQRLNFYGKRRIKCFKADFSLPASLVTKASVKLKNSRILRFTVTIEKFLRTNIKKICVIIILTKKKIS